MPFVPFYTRFPVLAERETRIVQVFARTPLPSDTYAFADSYCDDENCDCRRALLNVVSERTGHHLATINYGWESREYYQEWIHGGATESELDELTGPSLLGFTHQSELAPALFDLFQDLVFTPEYVERLKRHYCMFRDAVDEEYASRPRRSREADFAGTSRNEPCPCGSGKKYKRCCAR